ncbi:MAG: M56 family metallopeptidase [Bacteroidota bacterium]|nr:M56 family metallopeptidase [Bacteroidota bacterium]
MWTYLIQVSAAVTLISLIVAIIPRSRTSHDFVRHLILISWILAFLLPVFPISRGISSLDVVGGTLPTIEIGSGGSMDSAYVSGIWDWVLVAYWIGVAFMLTRFIRELYRVLTLEEGLRPIRKGSVLIFRSYRVKEPYSFWNRIHLPQDLPGEWEPIILSHETAHIRLHHSLDILLLELSSAFVWFLPPAWWLKKFLRNVHEYQVDRYVARENGLDAYREVLLQVLFDTREPMLLHGFSVTNLKNRIKMIRQPKPLSTMVKISMVSLVLLLITAVAGCEKSKEVTPVPEAQPTEAIKVAIMEADVPPRPEKCQDETNKENAMKCFQEGLVEHIIRTMKYPDEARERGLGGVAYVQFVINKDGKVEQVRVLKLSINGPEGSAEPTEAEKKLFADASTQVVEGLPEFSPAIKDGEPVSVEYTLPLKFALD